MSLSKRAEEYITTLKRNADWVAGAEETLIYLTENEFSLTEALVDFQSKYSGLQLTIKDDQFDAFDVRLFKRKAIKRNTPLDFDKVGDRYIFICGIHRTAQYTFFLTHQGEFCTLDDDDLPNVLNQSFEKVIEEYALKNEIYNWNGNPYYYDLRDADKLNSLMASRGFKVIDECSDQYATWWTNGILIVHKGVRLDGAEHYVRIYGLKQQDCIMLVNEFAESGIIRPNK